MARQVTHDSKATTGIGEHFPIGARARVLVQTRDAEGDEIFWLSGRVIAANYSGITLANSEGERTFVGAPFIVQASVTA